MQRATFESDILLRWLVYPQTKQLDFKVVVLLARNSNGKLLNRNSPPLQYSIWSLIETHAYARVMCVQASKRILPKHMHVECHAWRQCFICALRLWEAILGGTNFRNFEHCMTHISLGVAFAKWQKGDLQHRSCWDGGDWRIACQVYIAAVENLAPKTHMLKSSRHHTTKIYLHRW